MDASTRASGIEILGTAKGSRDIQMATLTLASSSMVRLMEKECIPGEMEKCTTENGTKDSSRGTAYGKECRRIPTLESGTHLKHMAMECILGQTATNMKANGRCVLSMDREQTPSYLVMSTQESTSMESLKEKESILGLIHRSTPVNSEKD